MPRCAFLTMSNLDGFFVYDNLVFEPMSKLGWQVEEIPWTAKTNWNDYDLVVIRSTWDYQNDFEHFLKILDEIDASNAQLQNSVEVVRWNINKGYLRDLSDRGVPIVPTMWLDHLTKSDVQQAQVQFEQDLLIVKPTVGANADDTFRIGLSDSETQNAFDVFKQKQLMLQPFMPSIVTEGEYSLFYFGGEYSHCILKKPAEDDFRVQEEHGGSLQTAEPNQQMRQAADATMAAIEQSVLYARVDLVRSKLGEDSFAVMELELIEPSLYFPFDKASPQRFAEAVDRL